MRANEQRVKLEMNFSGNASKLALAGAALAAAGVVIGLLSTRPARPPDPSSVASPVVATQAPQATPVVSPIREPFMANNYRPLTSNSAELGMATIPSPLVITNWEARLDQILELNVDEKAKAQQMLEVFPNLPEEGQEEYAQHLSNLVLDDDYAALAQHFTNSALPEAVLDVLLSDALNRPNELKLPALLGAARDPRHPKAGEAKDLLELYLEEDYGSDWGKWEAELGKWLKDNPD